MEIARIAFFDVTPTIYSHYPIPAGIVGATIKIEYPGEMWKNLTKTVIFRKYYGTGKERYSAYYTVEDAGNIVTIPKELVIMPRTLVQVGACGKDEEGKIVIPTIWVDLGVVRDSPNGVELPKLKQFP